MDIDEFRQNMGRPTDIVKPSDRKVILCPARLVLIKGHTYLFQALEQLKAEHCLVECWIADSGAMESMLKQEVMNRKLHDVVRFLGARQDIPALMAMADLVVLPTLHDTSPLVIMEAQTAGIPVISTMVGGVTEMIENDRTGLIVPPRDSTFLSQAILKVLRDPAKAQKIAATAKSEST
jgi:glycosyltransferase involved in cell wall biosynthesis